MDDNGLDAGEPARPLVRGRVRGGLAAHSPSTWGRSGKTAARAERPSTGNIEGSPRHRSQPLSRVRRLPVLAGHGQQGCLHISQDLPVRAVSCRRPRHNHHLNSLRKCLARSPIGFPNPPPSPISSHRSPDLPAHHERRPWRALDPSPHEQHRPPSDPLPPLENRLNVRGPREPPGAGKASRSHRPQLPPTTG